MSTVLRLRNPELVHYPVLCFFHDTTELMTLENPHGMDLA